MTTTLSTPEPGRPALADALEAELGPLGCEVFWDLGELTMVVPANQLLSACWTLRDHADLRFEQLIDLCGVDFAAYGQSQWETDEASTSGFGRGVDRDQEIVADAPGRFAVVIHLLSVVHNARLRLRVHALGEAPIVDSVVPVWAAAGWFEREAFDLYGILFQGHPDLRRILSDYGFIGHPFRKDFPLSGQVEMRYDPAQRRVVYEPISIEPRVLVPKVIREDSRYVRPADERSQEGGADA